jgi:hypothetical protein
VRDLAPLRRTLLSILIADACGSLEDISPLEGMRLTEISLTYRAKGIEVLRKMFSLKTIHFNYKPYQPAEFWRKYDAGEIK